MLSRYLTVNKFGQGELTIQKSQFITYVQRVETEEEALAFISSIKKKHSDANHNCSAYMIGEHNLIQKANDDGEPSGTAGVPMLEVLKKRNLKDTAVVITRYFGGIKLGGGGLIRAYGKATTEGINATGVVERRLNTIVHVTLDYTWLGKVENEIRSSIYPIKEMHYLDDVKIECYVEQDDIETFTEWMTELTNGQAIIETGEQEYVEHPVKS